MLPCACFVLWLQGQMVLASGSAASSLAMGLRAPAIPRGSFLAGRRWHQGSDGKDQSLVLWGCRAESHWTCPQVPPTDGRDTERNKLMTAQCGQAVTEGGPEVAPHSPGAGQAPWRSLEAFPGSRQRQWHV